MRGTISLKYIMLSLLFIVSLISCDRQPETWQRLELADSLIEDRSDSSLVILKSISEDELKGRKEKARYALLMSMALDKNYIDTTTFDVLQPAIDYYLKKGTSDEKLRTYYYQGVIYENQGKYEKALDSYYKGLDLSPETEDSLILARTLVAQAILLKKFQNYKSYTDNYNKAAEIYGKIHKKNLSFICLLHSLSGYIVLNEKNKADSVMNILNALKPVEPENESLFKEYRLAKAVQFDSTDQILNLLNDDIQGFGINGFLSLAMAYHKIGNNEKAEKILELINDSNRDYDSIRYLAIKVLVLQDQEKDKEALKTYFILNQKLDSLDVVKYDQTIKNIKEKHLLEIKNKEVSQRKTLIIWTFSIGLFVLLLIILLLLIIIRSHKVQKDLERQTTINIETENARLKSESEKLNLEKEKLLLEAENMAHRISTLEEESETLKNIIKNHKELPDEVQKAIKFRIEILNSLVAGYITNNEQFEKPYEEWVKEVKENSEEFMNSNRLAFQASHPRFIKYFEDHGLTISEINYVCLYALGLRGKEVGNYMKKRSHVNMSSAIRKKLGIDQHETNIGIYVRKLLKSL